MKFELNHWLEEAAPIARAIARNYQVESEDIIQEARIMLLQKAIYLADNEDRINESYVSVVIRNAAINACEKEVGYTGSYDNFNQSLDQYFYTSEVIVSLIDAYAQIYGSEQRYEIPAMFLDLDAAIDQLPALYRDVVIERLEGASLDTADRKRFSRALPKLKAEMNRMSYGRDYVGSKTRVFPASDLVA